LSGTIPPELYKLEGLVDLNLGELIWKESIDRLRFIIRKINISFDVDFVVVSLS